MIMTHGSNRRSPRYSASCVVTPFA
jgi:hypothetical protein